MFLPSGRKNSQQIVFSVYFSGATPSGLEFRQASSLVEILTPRMNFPYPTWTLMMDSYILTYETEIALFIAVLENSVLPMS